VQQRVAAAGKKKTGDCLVKSTSFFKALHLINTPPLFIPKYWKLSSTNNLNLLR